MSNNFLTNSDLKLGKADILFKVLAYTVTIIWVLLSLVPMYWLITSTMKDQISIHKTPPDWIPAMPQAYVFQIEYSSEDWNDTADREIMFETDFALVSWQIFDSYKTQNVGKVIVQAVVNNEVVASAQLRMKEFKMKRDNIWAATSLNPEQILKKINDVHEITVNTFESYKYNLHEKVNSYKSNDVTLDMKQYILKLDAIKGKLVDTYKRNSPESYLDNYVAAWNFPKQYVGTLALGRMFLNSIFISALSILGQWVFMGMSGYALSRLLGKKAAGLLLLFFLITLMIPSVATFIPLFFLFENLRLTNTLWAVVIPSVPNAFNLYLFKGFIDNLPNALFDAARVEGANEFKVFFKLILPLTKPVFGVIALFTFIGSWNDFFWPYLVLRSEELWTFTIMINKLLNIGTKVGGGVGGKIDYPMSLAMSVFACIPTLIVFGVFQRQLQSGLVFGGIKG